MVKAVRERLVDIVSALEFTVGAEPLGLLSFKSFSVEVLFKRKWLFCNSHRINQLISFSRGRQPNNPISHLGSAADGWFATGQCAAPPEGIRGEAGIAYYGV